MRVFIIFLFLSSYLFIENTNAQDTIKVDSVDIPRISLIFKNCAHKGVPILKTEFNSLIEEFESIEFEENTAIIFESIENHGYEVKVFFKDSIYYSNIKIENYCLNKKIKEESKNLVLLLNQTKFEKNPLKIKNGYTISSHFFPWKEYLEKTKEKVKTIKISNQKYSIKIKKNYRKDIITFQIYSLKKLKIKYISKKGKIISKTSYL